jgi:hypothetical protein
MSSSDWFGTAEYRRVRRFTLRACGVGLLLAYASVLPLKGLGWMPPHISWLGAVVAPLTIFAWLASPVIMPSWFPRRWELAFLVSTLLGAAVLLSVILLEREWSGCVASNP